MKIIEKSSERYNQIVKIQSKEKYHINHHELKLDEAVVCPNDEDMIVQKTPSGEICLIKKSYSKNPFL